MAVIEKRNYGYLCRIVVGYDANGNKIRRNEKYVPKAKSETAQRKEAQRYADELERLAARGELFNDDRITLADFFDQWKRDIAPVTLTLSKQEYYARVMETRFLPELGRMEIDKIRKSDVQRVITAMTREGLTPESVRTYLSVISSVLGRAEQMEIIGRNPARGIIRPKNEHKDEIHTFTVEQAKTFLSALDGEYPMEHNAHTRTLKSTGQTYTVPTYEQNSKVSTMWKAYFWLALFTGARRGEIVSLTWNDIDPIRNTITITKGTARTKAKGQIIKDPKSKAGNREIFVPAAVMEKLMSWKEEQREYAKMIGYVWMGKTGKEYDKNFIFTQNCGKQMDVSSPTAKFKDILRMYNNSVSEPEQLPDIHLHDLRHCTASILIASGMDIASVSRMLGHADIAVTLSRYTHALTKSNAAIADTLELLLTDKNETERTVYAA